MINKNLVGIIGPKQSGKTTVFNYLNTLGYSQYAFADPIKRGLQEMFGFTNEQLWGSEEQKEAVDEYWGISARRMMKLVGTELFQFDIHKYTQPGEFDFNRKVWVYKFKKWYNSEIAKNPDLKLVVTDMRFPHEAKAIKDMGGLIIKIDRPSIKRTDTHASETEYQIVKEDIKIINDSTLENYYKKLQEIFGS
jgi:energy-coupling factor transporter ATP-binding protein EcfA2